MLLRSTLERILPVGQGEEHLSKEARRMAFRGRYLGRKFQGARPETYHDYEDNGRGILEPVIEFHDVVVRTGFFGKEHKSFGGLVARFSSSTREDVDPGDKLRVRHIEDVARAVKVSSAIAAIGILSLLGPNEIPQPDLPFGVEDTGTLTNTPLATDPMFQISSPEAEHRV